MAQVVQTRDASPLSWFGQGLPGASKKAEQSQGMQGVTPPEVKELLLRNSMNVQKTLS